MPLYRTTWTGLAAQIDDLKKKKRLAFLFFLFKPTASNRRR